MRKIITVFFISTLALSITSCRTTQIKAFTDPDYTNFTIRKFVIEADSEGAKQVIKDRLSSLDVEYTFANELFLPTRQYTKDDIANIILKQGYDSYLYIGIGKTAYSSNVTSYQTNTQTTYTQNTNPYTPNYGGINATGTSTTTPMTSHKSRTKAEAKLYDVRTGRVIWVANLDSEAGGKLYMNESGTDFDIAKKVVASLIAKGHLQPSLP